MGKRKWWELPTPDYEYGDVIDGPEVVDVDDENREEDWLDTFRFDDYKADKGLSSTDAIWNRYGSTGSSFSGLPYSRSWSGSTIGKSLGVDFGTAKKIEAAQKLVQGFVDTFAIDNPLRARFSDKTAVLGGEEGEQAVVVSHRPLLDPTLAETEAHRVMTAQAAQAAARARYGGAESAGRRTSVNWAFGGRPEIALASEVAQVLDGYRIDSSFRRDYPGYEDVYAPAQRYIAKGLLGERESFDLEDFAGASIANAALNFGEYTNWSGRESEQTWWSDWADAYAHGTVEQFVEGVEKAVEHIQVALPPKPETPPDKPKDDGGDEPKGPKGDGKGTGKGKGKGDEQGETPDDDEQDDTDSPSGAGDDESDDDEQDDDDQKGKGGNGSGQDEVNPAPSEDDDEWGDEPQEDPGKGTTNGQVTLPTALGDGVSLTGLANGQTKDIDELEAEKLAATSSALAIGKDEKEIGEVYWSANGFNFGGYRNQVIHPKAESSANGYIRRAFTRSKTAHYATERGHKNGRIDNRSLPRIASDDYRLFSKRTAPSETRYRVWLLIDNSGSMGSGGRKAAADLAASVALAVRHIPNVALDVWAWTSGLKVAGSSFSAVRVYADGQPVSEIGKIGLLGQGGTPDAEVLSWATREIRKQCRPDETPVILMASDGQGDLSGEAIYRDPDLRDRYRKAGYTEDQISEMFDTVHDDRVAVARKAGVKVLSVAIGALDVATQDRIYGKGNHLIWTGSIRTMAKPLGDLLAKVASNRVK